MNTGTLCERPENNKRRIEWTGSMELSIFSKGMQIGYLVDWNNYNF